MPKLLVRSVAAVAITLAIFAGTVVASGGPHAHGGADGAAAAGSAVAARTRFHDAMRQLWEDHITWTRLVIVSAATLPDALPDVDPTVQRLLRNQDDIGDAIKPFYGDAGGEELSRLLREPSRWPPSSSPQRRPVMPTPSRRRPTRGTRTRTRSRTSWARRTRSTGWPRRCGR